MNVIEVRNDKKVLLNGFSEHWRTISGKGKRLSLIKKKCKGVNQILKRRKNTLKNKYFSFSHKIFLFWKVTVDTLYTSPVLVREYKGCANNEGVPGEFLVVYWQRYPQYEKIIVIKIPNMSLFLKCF